MTFSTLEVQESIVKALHEQGINTPTTIQQKAIPSIIAGKDVIGMSTTGSGKTVAFGIPVIQRVTPKQGLQALLLAPTRELAVQIANELKKFSRYLDHSVATIFGGVGMEPQIDALTTADIVVGTPGRVLDHLNRRTMDLSKLHCFVLDEADKMVEMGFIEDIEEILRFTPANKQILLFGATLSSEIDYLKKAYMCEPLIAEAELRVKEDLLEQYYYNTQPHEKFSLLVHLLKKEETEQVIVFCSARSTVELVTKNLRQQGIKAISIHGKLSQNRRLQVIGQFHDGKTNVLVASAVAARGLDIKGISHVINYDLSRDPQEYIHRVGRTARAGASGKAITLLCPRDHGTFHQVLDRFRMPVEELLKEKFAQLRFDARINQNREGRYGQGRNQRSFSSRNGSSRRNSRPGNRRNSSGPRRSYN